MKHYIGIFIIIFIAVIVPISSNADNFLVNNISDRYDLSSLKTYQVEGNSMKTLGFANGVLVDVVTASEMHKDDIIAFECYKEECDGAYIKRIAKKQGNCYWLEGRHDIWEESGKRKMSLDSRTTYGWLCDDEIKIYGLAFLKGVIKI